MSASVTRRVTLASRPVGIPQAKHFKIMEGPVPEIGDGQVLVRTVYWSVEPAMRGWVNAVGNYSEPVAVGAVMRSLASGIVEASKHPDYQVGDAVTGMLGWQQHAAVDAENISHKIDADGPPLSTSLGVLGLNGVTAYFGLLDIGQPKPGETVVVSTAAGAVGSAVGQIAKISGCRTVGIAGGPDKVRQCLETFGFDACIDYKADDLTESLKQACPDGVDVYFDNTAGPISDAVMGQLSVGARVIICGTASISSWDPIPAGPRVERHILVKRARMQGLLIFDYADRHAEGRAQLAKWITSGQLRYVEDVLQGVDQAPDAIAGLYRGENKGKRLIQVSEDPTLAKS
ncbi:MAG: NADP-dependent oxidoreductase [Burkholderiaceae bacterium]